ncbi:hypothetical protein CTI14_68925, partial [Methylobacterium radiotolerans]
GSGALDEPDAGPRRGRTGSSRRRALRHDPHGDGPRPRDGPDRLRGGSGALDEPDAGPRRGRTGSSRRRALRHDPHGD